MKIYNVRLTRGNTGSWITYDLQIMGTHDARERLQLLAAYVLPGWRVSGFELATTK